LESHLLLIFPSLHSGIVQEPTETKINLKIILTCLISSIYELSSIQNRQTAAEKTSFTNLFNSKKNDCRTLTFVSNLFRKHLTVKKSSLDS